MVRQRVELRGPVAAMPEVPGGPERVGEIEVDFRVVEIGLECGKDDDFCVQGLLADARLDGGRRTTEAQKDDDQSDHEQLTHTYSCLYVERRSTVLVTGGLKD